MAIPISPPEKGNLYLTKIDLVEKKFAVRKIITVTKVTYMQKNSLFELILLSYWQNFDFSRNCPTHSHIM